MDKKRFSVVDEDDDLEGLDFDNNSNSSKRLKTNNNNDSNNNNSNNSYNSISTTTSKNKAMILQLINSFHQNNKKFCDKIIKDNLIVLGDPIIIDDVIKLRKRLNNFFSYNSSDQLLLLFKDGLSNFLSEEKLLELALSPVVSEDPDSERNFQSSFFIESLIKIFLSIPVIQPMVINILFQLMDNYLTDDPNDFIKKICSQLRWMDNIRDSDALVESTSNLLDNLVCNLELKKEVIGFLPDITDEKCHEQLVPKLVSSFDNEPTLILPIIDCLKNMNLKTSELLEVRSKISESLISAEMADLPLMVGFLLTTNNPKESLQTVRSIRNGLKFSNNFRNTSKDLIDFDKKRILNDSNKNKQSEALIMEVIRSGIRFKKELWTAFLKEISSISLSKDHKIIDIWLLILISSINQPKETESLFKKKILNGLFTKQLLLDSIITHDYALGSYHPQMLSFCNCFLRSNETRIRLFGSLFYQYLYGSFNEISLRQDIIVSLLSHICSNNITEVNSGLDVLLELCKNYLESIKDFTTYIKSILDHINFLNESQIRKLFKIFSYLLYNTTITGTDYSLSQNASVYNELDIFTRKQITSPFLKFKKIGIISLCSQLSRLAKKVYKSTSTMEFFNLPPQIKDQCMHIFEILYHNCSGSQLALAYYYDELSNCYLEENFHPIIAREFLEKFGNDFQQRFIETIGDERDILWCDPNDGQDYESISIYPSLKEMETKDKLLCLSPHFRLLQILQKSNSLDGSLDDISNLSAIPFKMFKKDLLKESKLSDDKDKEFYGLSIFYLINLFKELLNAFTNYLIINDEKKHHGNNESQSLSQQANGFFDFNNDNQQPKYNNNNNKITTEEMKSRLLNKLRNLIEFEEYFELVLSCSPSFSIPYGTFDFDQRKNFSIDFRRTKKPSPIFTLYPIENTKQFKLPTESFIELDKPFIKLIKPYFRQLDLNVFLILQQQISNSNSTIVLEPSSLLYILEDFYSKLIILTTQEKTGPLATMQPKSTLPYSYTEFITKCQFVFPNLCSYLDSSVKSFTSNRIKLIKELRNLRILKKEMDQVSNRSDGDEDEDEDDSPSPKETLKTKIEEGCKVVMKLNDKQIVLQRCIQLLLKCFEKLFQTGDLISPDSNNNSLFFSVMRLIYDKVRNSFASDQNQQQQDTVQTTGSLQIISLRIFSYFERFIQPLVASNSFRCSFSLLEVFISLSSNSWSNNNRDNEELNNKIYRYSYLLLSTPWAQGDKQKVSTTEIGSIFNTFLNYSKSPRNSLKLSIIFLYSYLRDHQSSGKGQKNVITTTSSTKKKKNMSNNDSEEEDNSNDESDGDNNENSNDEQSLVREVEELKGSRTTYADFMSTDDDIEEIQSTLIKQNNSLVFLRTIFSFLVEYFSKDVNRYKEKDPSISSVLTENNASVAYFTRLVETFRFREKSLYLAEILKQGIAFVDVYSKFLGILKVIIKKNGQAVEDFVSTFEKLQTGTRLLHNICDHGKKEKDTFITTFVPQAKKTLETLNMDIKILLSSMNALNAYSTKKINRTNLKGKEISSSQEDEDEYEQDEEESDNQSQSDEEEEEDYEIQSSDSNNKNNKNRKNRDRDRSISIRDSKRRDSDSDSDSSGNEEKKKRSNSKSTSRKRLRKLKSNSDSDEEMSNEEQDSEDDNRSVSRGRSRNRSRSIVKGLYKQNQSSSRSRSPSISISDNNNNNSEAEEGDESDHSASEPENGIDIESENNSDNDENKQISSNNEEEEEDDDDDFIASD